MMSPMLPYIFKEWLSDTISFDLAHANCLLRTPFHSLPIWLLDSAFAHVASKTSYMVRGLEDFSQPKT